MEEKKVVGVVSGSYLSNTHDWGKQLVNLQEPLLCEGLEGCWEIEKCQKLKILVILVDVFSVDIFNLKELEQSPHKMFKCL